MHKNIQFGFVTWLARHQDREEDYLDIAYQARIQGGGGAKGALPPPPIFWGKKQGGPQTTHTEKKRSKSDNHEARYRLKRTPKHTKYAQIFLKKLL